MGLDTREMYLQGMSSSLPEEVQLRMYRTIPGLEGVELMRTAYAIEYDCIDPTQLRPTLEVKNVPGLFGAGQFNPLFILLLPLLEEELLVLLLPDEPQAVAGGHQPGGGT